MPRSAHAGRGNVLSATVPRMANAIVEVRGTGSLSPEPLMTLNLPSGTPVPRVGEKLHVRDPHGGTTTVTFVIDDVIWDLNLQNPAGDAHLTLRVSNFGD